MLGPFRARSRREPERLTVPGVPEWDRGWIPVVCQVAERRHQALTQEGVKLARVDRACVLPARRVVARPRDGYHRLGDRSRYSIAHDTGARCASRDGQQNGSDGRHAKPLRRAGDGNNGCALLATGRQRCGDTPDAREKLILGDAGALLQQPEHGLLGPTARARNRHETQGVRPLPGRREDVLVVVAHPEQHRLAKSLDKLIGEGAEPFEDAELSGCRSP